MLDEVQKIGATILAMAALCGILWKIIVRLARLTRKVIRGYEQFLAVWEFLSDRGLAKARRTGILIQTPADQLDGVRADVRRMFHEMAPDLRATYRKEWVGLSDAKLTLEILERFGKRILADVCVPLNIDDGECIAAAAVIAQESDTLLARPPGR